MNDLVIVPLRFNSGNPYEVLGLAKTDSPEKIRATYRSLAVRYHPDKGGDRDLFGKIQWAYGVLKDPDLKEMYDDTGCHEVDLTFFKTIEQYAIKTLLSSLVDDSPNPVADVEQDLKGKIKQNKNNIRNQNTVKKKVLARFERLSHKNDIKKTKLYAMFQGQLEELRNETIKSHQQVIALNKVIPLIKDFSFEVEEEEEGLVDIAGDFERALHFYMRGSNL